MPRLILISGIPGSGKTTYGELLKSRYGFVHYDLENPLVRGQVDSDSSGFIDSILSKSKDAVVTWGFFPDAEAEVDLVKQFRANGFELVWFDGNRSAALQAFVNRGTIPEGLFHLQVWRIEISGILQKLGPLVIDTFDKSDLFKDVAIVLQEIENG